MLSVSAAGTARRRSRTSATLAHHKESFVWTVMNLSCSEEERKRPVLQGGHTREQSWTSRCLHSRPAWRKLALWRKSSRARPLRRQRQISLAASWMDLLMLAGRRARLPARHRRHQVRQSRMHPKEKKRQLTTVLFQRIFFCHQAPTAAVARSTIRSPTIPPNQTVPGNFSFLWPLILLQTSDLLRVPKPRQSRSNLRVIISATFDRETRQ